MSALKRHVVAPCTKAKNPGRCRGSKRFNRCLRGTSSSVARARASGARRGRRRSVLRSGAVARASRRSRGRRVSDRLGSRSRTAVGRGHVGRSRSRLIVRAIRRIRVAHRVGRIVPVTVPPVCLLVGIVTAGAMTARMMTTGVMTTRVMTAGVTAALRAMAALATTITTRSCISAGRSQCREADDRRRRQSEE